MLSITDLATEFDISARTIRYYEERGFYMILKKS